MQLTIRESQKHQAGFTIVEFMIATAIFSIVLLLCAFAILHVGRMFYKGVIINRTQDVSRKLSEDLGDTIRFGTGSPDPDIFHDSVRSGAPFTFASGSSAYIHTVCLGTNRYTYSVAFPVSTPSTPTPTDGTTHMKPMGTGTGMVNVGLWKDRRDGTSGACTLLNIADPLAVEDSRTRLGGQELLTEKMRVSRFLVEQSPVDGSLWRVTVRISFGDEDLLFTDGPTASQCKGSEAGGQFCAVSELATYVTKRL